MNCFSPAELTANYAKAGVGKTKLPVGKILVLSMLAGFLIALGSAVTNTATYALDNVSVMRTVSGLLFPFGLAMVILSGAELFTGNNLIFISVLDRQARLTGMLRNWIFVYIGNFIGSLFVAASCAFFGQMNYGGGALAVFTIKLAIGKCSMSFSRAVVMGIFCNLLVCLAVLLAMSAKDTFGKIAGAYLPVAYFVFCGFEHCVANMYYVPAGIFAAQVPQYAELAAEAGLDTSALNWGSFISTNLLPVTFGNIISGLLMASLMWYAYLKKGKKKAEYNDVRDNVAVSK